ncbi:hypothetical protein ACOSQ2_019521 [Xanthoceras sorbifolium]
MNFDLPPTLEGEDGGHMGEEDVPDNDIDYHMTGVYKALAGGDVNASARTSVVPTSTPTGEERSVSNTSAIVTCVPIELPSYTQTSTEPNQKEAAEVQDEPMHVPSQSPKRRWMLTSEYRDPLERKKLRSERQYHFNPHLPIKPCHLTQLFIIYRKYQPSIAAVDPGPDFPVHDIDWPEDMIQLYASGDGR